MTISNFDLSLLNVDPIVGKIIQQIERPIIQSTKDVFHDLISCIVEQQIHYRSSKRIFAKALERAGIERLTIQNFHLMEDYGLSQIKLSMNKLETINAVVDYWAKNTLDFNTLSDEEVIKELASIKGIGKWTIDMILLYTLQRPTIFPFDDFRLKQIMIELYQLNPNVKLKNQMLEIANQWGENKSIAVLYLLEWKKQKKLTYTL